MSKSLMELKEIQKCNYIEVIQGKKQPFYTRNH